ncbi:S-adenosyl-L-methionine-dependent methyltransferase [Amylocarpus encephaloides]|uniref:S-adenosyl-L-methionine-dependent methyltransferase n=1 Tax=Amylocarpus encephaloides TaxID=45428 RepID=A0A9P7YR68_9HELO|nr:S-adenosyl-L-methionine-dependent methyltransferase [Amylocarpus encephaloides]
MACSKEHGLSSGFHDAHSNTYDQMASNCTLNIAKQFVKDLPLPITNDSHILDNACGTGLVTLLLKQTYPNLSPKIHGSDIAPNMLEIYTSRAKEHEWSNISTSVEDVMDLKGLKDDTFTHVFTNFGIMAGPSSPDSKGPLRAVKEIYRVTRKGGVAVTTTWWKRGFDVAMEKTTGRVKPGEKAFSFGSNGEWETGRYLMGMMEDAGFKREGMSVKCVKGAISARSLEELVENNMLFKDIAYKGYSEEELGQVRVILAEELQKLEVYKKTDDGVEVEQWAWIGVGFK